MGRLISAILAIGIIFSSCRGQVQEQAAGGALAVPESKVVAALAKGGEAQSTGEVMKSGLPEKMMEDLIFDINRHKIEEADKAYFIGQLKHTGNLIDGALIGAAVKKLEHVMRQKLLGREMKDRVRAKVKSELERGLKTTSQDLKMKIMLGFQR